MKPVATDIDATLSRSDFMRSGTSGSERESISPSLSFGIIPTSAFCKG